MRTSKKPALIGIAAVLLAIAGYWAYAAHDKRTQERAVAGLIAGTTAQLRAGLADAPGRALPEVESHFERLQALKSSRAHAFADNAELYILSAREILRRRQLLAAQEERAGASRAALAAHMQLARSRGPSWIHDAATLKRKVEAEHAELARTLGAIDELLEELPMATKKLAPLVESSALLDDAARRAARRQLSEERSRAERQLAELRRIGA